jgi:hypothetical protein
MVQGLRKSSFAIQEFSDLHSALGCMRSERCSMLVMTQPRGWSLERTAREVRPACGDDRVIVLSSDGATFVPGLYVLSGAISSEALGRLIRRISPNFPELPGADANDSTSMPSFLEDSHGDHPLL